MRLNFSSQLAAAYTSVSQKARVMTEHWVGLSAFCPSCGQISLKKHANNNPVGDFFCGACSEDYELKSKQGVMGLKIVDGAYRTMMERLESSSNPNLFFLNYDQANAQVIDFLVIPKHFFIPDLIEKRTPLAATARRAGWVGCNILAHKVPAAGKIFLVQSGAVTPKEKVLSEWQRTLFLRDEKKAASKGWLLDVMRSVEKIGKREFSLADVYAFEPELARLHPENKHVRDKIRQQLQVLRDRGFLEFESRGCYALK